MNRSGTRAIPWRAVSRWVLAVLFVGAGINHFIAEDFYVSIMPDYLPWPRAMVIISGVAEIALGVLVLPARTRTLAGWGLIALLVAVFPANVHMAMHPERFPDLPPVALWGRLPLQAVMIAWVAWTTQLRGPWAHRDSAAR